MASHLYAASQRNQMPTGAGRALTTLRSATLTRFLVAGGISYLVNQSALFLLYEHVVNVRVETGPGWLESIDTGLLLASAIALELSILVRFAFNDAWTFRGRANQPFVRRLLQSNLGSLCAPAIALAAVNLLTPVFGISYLVANSIGILAGLGWNWFWSNRVVWRRDPVIDPTSN